MRVIAFCRRRSWSCCGSRGCRRRPAGRGDDNQALVAVAVVQERLWQASRAGASTRLSRKSIMPTDNLSGWIHDHVFDAGNAAAERSTRLVMAIAVVIAMLGLLVNRVCALILGRAHHHDHGNSRGHDDDRHHEHHRDLNLKSTYLHVIADAATPDGALTAADLRARLSVHEEIVHSTIEIHRFPDTQPPALA